MNCPMHCLIFGSRTRSYRELPLRLFEFGTVYRYERSGVLHGLLRTRGFTQDDSHIYCTPDQIVPELTSLLGFQWVLPVVHNLSVPAAGVPWRFACHAATAPSQGQTETASAAVAVHHQCLPATRTTTRHSSTVKFPSARGRGGGVGISGDGNAMASPPTRANIRVKDRRMASLENLPTYIPNCWT
jgi:hypothetical protein